MTVVDTLIEIRYIYHVMRTAIIGTGGVGGYLGAKLHRAGNDVVFAARGDHLAAMRKNGLKLESPEGGFRINADFTDRLDGLEPFDCIVVCVKSYDTPAAAETAGPGIAENTIILSIQNGVENEDIIARRLGGEHVLTGIAYIFSTILKPGVIRHEGGAGKFRFGEMDGTVSGRCLMLEKIFLSAGLSGEATAEIGKFLWQKWIFICALGGMTAFAKKPIGDIMRDAMLRKMLEEVIAEASAVARGMYGDPFLNSENLTLAHCRRLDPGSTSSMYYDLTHGKRVEISALNGAAVRFGEKLGILTPANRAIYDALKKFSG